MMWLHMFVCLFVRYWRCHVHGVPSCLSLLHVCLFVCQVLEVPCSWCPFLSQSTTCLFVCLSGIGGAMFMVSLLVSVYYNVIIAWAIFYMFSSFSSPLPWATCMKPWNSPREFFSQFTFELRVNRPLSRKRHCNRE